MFEKVLWGSRLLTFLPVVFSLIGGAVLFLVASLDIWNVATYTLNTWVTGAHPKDFHEVIVAGIIGAIDLYLMAVVMLLFSFGIYELFISEIDEAKGNKVLTINSLDQLKDKLAKVIIMVLIVSFFQRVLHTNYNSALEMLYFAGSIFALAFALYYLHKGGEH